jgi:small conductance mechanosensitive channel
LLTILREVRSLRLSFTLCLFLGLLSVTSFGISFDAEAQEPAGSPQVEADGPSTDDPQPLVTSTLLPDQISQVTEQSIDPEVLVLRLVPLTVQELETAAKTWLSIVRAKNQVVAEAQVELNQSDDEINGVARERLQRLIEERNRLFDKFTSVVRAWKKKGGTPEKIKEYTTYRDSILLDETLNFDIETLTRYLARWAVDRNGGVDILVKIGILSLALVLLVLIARIARAALGRAVSRIPDMSELLQNFLAQALFWFILAIGLFVVMTLLGADVTPAFAVMGGAVFVLAFAMQDALGNLVAGLMIMTYRPFDLRDYVEVEGAEGTVRSVSIASTRLHTPDNKVVSVPNGRIWGNVIVNHTANFTRRVDLTFGISYGDSIQNACAILSDCVANHPLCLKAPLPNIQVHQLGESSVDIICRPWVKRDDYYTVFWDLQRIVKERFDAEGITIPFPQRQLHVYNHWPDQAKADPLIAD